jgi:hypothetical protein
MLKNNFLIVVKLNWWSELDNEIIKRNFLYFIIDEIYFLLFQNKAKLVTYVIASGLTYGAEESIFHYLFKVTVLASHFNEI